jgi:hypothetical protein
VEDEPALIAMLDERLAAAAMAISADLCKHIGF